MFSEILATIKTTQDRNELLKELTAIRNNQFQNESYLEKLLSSEVAFSRSNALRSLVNDKGTFKKNITELFKQVHSLKVVEITVGYGLTDAVIDRIYHYLVDSIGYQVILKLTVNQRILGGAIISFEGKYGDFSVEQKLLAYTKSHKNDLLKIFTSKISL